MLDIFAEAYRNEALAFIDKTLDNVADLPPDLSWKNSEVVAMIEDIRSLLVSGVLVPGGFTREPTETPGPPRMNDSTVIASGNVPGTNQPVCTCPSGDGSLRWPCPVHPPTDHTDGDRDA